MASAGFAERAERTVFFSSRRIMWSPLSSKFLHEIEIEYMY